MSAFVCNPRTIGTVARTLVETLAVAHQSQAEDRDYANLAENMAMVNLKSVGHRYDLTPDQAASEFQGMTVAQYVSKCREESRNLKNLELPISRVHGAASCWLYQSCEFPNYEENAVYRVVRDFAAHLKASGIESDGWDL